MHFKKVLHLFVHQFIEHYEVTGTVLNTRENNDMEKLA